MLRIGILPQEEKIGSIKTTNCNTINKRKNKQIEKPHKNAIKLSFDNFENIVNQHHYHSSFQSNPW